MPETLRFKPRAIDPPASDLNLTAHQLRGSAFLEALRVEVQDAGTSADCRAIYAVLAEAEERIATIATACMQRENWLQMKGK